MRPIIYLLGLIIINIVIIHNINSQTRDVIIEVRDQERNPVNGVVIQLTHGVLGSEEQYRANFLQEGRYEVSIPRQLIDSNFEMTLSGDHVETLRRSMYWGGENRFLVTVERVPFSIFEVIARDEENQPVRDVRITVISDETGRLNARHIENGEYQVELPTSLEGQRLTLEAVAEDYEPLSRQIRWRDEEPISIVLTKSYTVIPVTFTVSGQDGYSIRDALVTMGYQGDELTPVSEERGRYTFELNEELIGEFLQVEINAEGYNPLRESVHWTGEETFTRTLEKEIAVEPAPLITVALMNRENEPVEYARVTFRPSERDEFVSYNGIYQRDGLYISQIPDFREGMELSVEVNADEYDSKTHHFTWQGTDHVEEITLAKIRGLSLDIQVVDNIENMPVDNAYVRLLAHYNGQIEEYIADSRGSGRYSVELPPDKDFDEFTVAIDAQDFESVQRMYDPRMGESITYSIRRVSKITRNLFFVPVIGYGRSHVDLGNILINGVPFTVDEQAGFVQAGLQVLYGQRFQIGTEFNYGLIPMRFQWSDDEMNNANITMEIDQLSLSAFAKYNFNVAGIRTHLKGGVGYYIGDITLNFVEPENEQINDNNTTTVELTDDIGFNAGVGFTYPLGNRIMLITEVNYNIVAKDVSEEDGQTSNTNLRLNSFIGQFGVSIAF